MVCHPLPKRRRVLQPIPDPLVVQWKDDLQRRFLLDAGELEEPVCVLSVADRAAVAPALAEAGMLVVDSNGHRPHKSQNGFTPIEFANQSKMSQTRDRSLLRARAQRGKNPSSEILMSQMIHVLTEGPNE